MKQMRSFLLIGVIAILPAASLYAQEKKTLDLTDLMKFKQIQSPSISDDGKWGSGLARQFQYEKSQSRIGGNLWEARDKYIENSPVFFADRIETPLLIMFGDVDDAVPWYQGIELYLKGEPAAEWIKTGVPYKGK
jgi:hypothetical protein